jgi:GNAT superfamily N-acetyltransferase
MNLPSTFTLETSTESADLALLEAQVAAAILGAARQEQEQEFAIVVRSAEGAVCAGVSGTVVGRNCELVALWVDTTLRRQGLASALVTAAEDEARRRGCLSISLLTYDAMTHGFFDGLGYRTVGTADGIRWYRKAVD